MIQDIKYSGYSTQPSDYECADGQLSASINLINEEGTLKTIYPPSVVQDNFGASDFSPVASFVHKSASFPGNHYVFAFASGLVSYAIGDLEGQPFSRTIEIATMPEGAEIRDINALGNVLIVATSVGMFYFLWEKNAYTALGNHVPRLNLSFSLGGYLSTQSSSLNYPSTIKTADFYTTIDNDDCWPIVQQAAKTAYSLLSGNASQKGWFTQPFFVRYALRMFDGSLVNISAPILQVPNSAAPRFGAKAITVSDDKTSGVSVYCQSMVTALYYRLLDSSEKDLLQKWSTLISAVEVYVSMPITIPDINNAKLIASKRTGAYVTGSYVGAFSSDAINDLPNIKNKSLLSSTTQWKVADIIKFADRSSYYLSGNTHANLVPNCRSDKDIAEAITSVSQFYKISEISFGSLVAALIKGTSNPILVPLASNSLNLLNLATFPTLSAYPTESSDTFAPDNMTAYNNRLSVSNVIKLPAPPNPPATMFPQIDAELSYDSDDGFSSSTDEQAWYQYQAYVRIEENDKSIWRVASSSAARVPFAGRDDFAWGNFVYYPNSNAKELVIVCYRSPMVDDARTGWRFYLTPHEFLAGAYAFIGLNAARENSNIDLDDFFNHLNIDETEGFDYPNKIYTSEINNPFVFPDSGVNTMGSTGAEILATATAAKALSAGQFGQFPLYAFTDEGVWAMEVSSSGGFIARQPITRDVCISPEGITQIDSSVLFPTDRGIMLISGSDTICISDPINNTWPIRLSDFPGLQALVNKHFPEAQFTEIAPFHDFLTADSRMVYDYVNQRIIVYNPAYGYAYVYSLKSKLWGMMLYNVRRSLNSYPEALAINSDGQLVNFSKSNTEAPVTSLLLTRPIKLGLPDILKTVDTVIQRGNFKSRHVQSVLYGSRNLDSWPLIWSSKDHFMRGFRGSPYKYFRIALLCDLAEDESIYGATMQYDTRKTNQPR
ncbi:MAG: hypothetical protein HDR46_01080 [Bacteroides sp.]|nr:hypothetical protein [Bacteroides sp.]